MPAGEIVSSTNRCVVGHRHGPFTCIRSHRGLQKARQTISGMVNVQLAAQIGVLGGDAAGQCSYGSIPAPNASPIAWDSRRWPKGNPIGSKGHGLDEVGGRFFRPAREIQGWHDRWAPRRSRNGPRARAQLRGSVGTRWIHETARSTSCATTASIE